MANTVPLFEVYHTSRNRKQNNGFQRLGEGSENYYLIIIFNTSSFQGYHVHIN